MSISVNPSARNPHDAGYWMNGMTLENPYFVCDACWSQLMQSGILVVRFKALRPLTKAKCIRTHSVGALLFSNISSMLARREKNGLHFSWQHHHQQLHTSSHTVPFGRFIYLIVFIRLNQQLWIKLVNFTQMYTHTSMNLIQLFWCQTDRQRFEYKWTTLFKTPWFGMVWHGEWTGQTYWEWYMDSQVVKVKCLRILHAKNTNLR